jgi:heptosyltransferase-2
MPAPAPQRLLIVMPSWLGDCVMATPTLRALRALDPNVHITALIKRPFKPVLDACPWVDRLISVPASSGGPVRLGRRLARGRFDAAVLLPNSFRTALMVRLAGVPRRIGYDRDGRGRLLTDRLTPPRDGRRFTPVPAVQYYLDIARHLGAADPDPTMQLCTRPADDARAEALLRSADHDAARPLIVLTPGANYGDAKLWPAERFAAVADALRETHHATIAVSGAPRERPILDQFIAASAGAVIDLPKLGVGLRLLKSVVKRSSLVITNDTGPRHLAAALGAPVVTIFGPTDPAWTVIDYPAERIARVDVWCGPCQKKQCPLEGTADFHICMKRVTEQMVVGECEQLLNDRGAVDAV